MNKEITIERWNYSKVNGRIAFSKFQTPSEVKAVKEVRRESSNRRINDYHFKNHSGWLEIKGDCEKVICKVWWEENE